MRQQLVERRVVDRTLRLVFGERRAVMVMDGEAEAAGSTRHRVVIVGGGFAGLYAALGVDRALGWSEKLELTVIDRKNYFLFPPLLPSVAVGATNASGCTVAAPARTASAATRDRPS